MTESTIAKLPWNFATTQVFDDDFPGAGLHFITFRKQP